MSAGKPEIPHQSPVTPEMLSDDSKFNFRKSAQQSAEDFAKKQEGNKS